MHHLQFLLCICSSAFALASFLHGSGEKDGTEVWQITKKNGIKKLKSEDFEFISTSSYIVLRTENDRSESTRNVVGSSEKGKTTGIHIGCFSLTKELVHVYYIHYMIQKQTETLDKNYENKIVNYIIELFDYVRKRSSKDVTIFRETRGKETSEFIKLFPHVLQQKAEDTEELCSKKISELKINARLQNLYKIERETKIIKEVPLNMNELNANDAFVADAGTDLIVVFNRSKSLKQLTTNFTQFIKRQKSRVIENIHYVENVSNLKSSKPNFLKLFKIFNEDECISNTLEKEFIKTKESYLLHEFSDTDGKRIFDTNKIGPITSDMIVAKNWYVLKNFLTEEIFLYIAPNVKIEIMRFILNQGQSYAWLYNRYKVSIVQHHALTVPFVIAFKDLMKYFKDDNEELLDTHIKEKLCKY